jgi:hypothetical protein
VNTVPSRLFALALLCAGLVSPATGSSSREWRFEVFLDDKPIGFHHFELSGDGETRSLRSEARFRVKVLGLTVYDYDHRSLELWQQDCLRRIDASTDDNGKDYFVRGDSQGRQLRLENTAGSADLSGCVMTFAYWNPAILQQQRLLNVQTGEYLEVDVQPLGATTLQVKGREVPALHYRISTADRNIELWYSAEREWLGLSSTARGGRLLHYRRIPAGAEMEGDDDE